MDLDRTLQKTDELQPQCRYAARLWIQDCFRLKLFFRITEVFRSQARQDALYTIGRRGIAGERPVTWTKQSRHTQRLACDILVENCTYKQVEDVARQYGIVRPPDLVKLGDYGHFEFGNAIQEPKKPSYTPSAIIRQLQRLIARAQSALQKSRLQERLDAFLRSISR